MGSAGGDLHDPAKLRHGIVDLIRNETGVGMSADIKGDAYEGLLKMNVQPACLAQQDKLGRLLAQG